MRSLLIVVALTFTTTSMLFKFTASSGVRSHSICKHFDTYYENADEETHLLEIQCWDNKTIRMTMVIYGRVDATQTTCQPPGGYTTTCLAHKAMKVVADRCNGKQTCSMHVNSTVMGGDSCAKGASKSLEVEWQCLDAKGEPSWSLNERLPNEVCNNGWEHHGAKCYMVGARPARWTEAVEGCRRQGGAQLAEFKGIDEIDEILREIGAAHGYENLWLHTNNRNEQNFWTEIMANTPSGPICEFGWQLHINEDAADEEDKASCYKLSDTEADWNTAITNCKAEGADLLVPPGHSVNEFVKNLFAAASGVSVAWIKSKPEGSEENCAYIRQNGSWMGARCSLLEHYICKKPAIVGTGNRTVFNQGPMVPPEPECDYGYTYDSGACYKVSADETFWRTAVRNCQADGAMLVRPTTQAENEIIMNKYRESGIWNGWLNIEYDSHAGKWKDGLGNYLPGTWTHWKNGSPRNVPNNRCSYMHSNDAGKWDYKSCDFKLRYICSKKSPDMPCTDPWKCGKTCVNMNTQTAKFTANVDCSNKYNYICEIPAYEPCPQGWVGSAEGGRYQCYRHYVGYHNWTQALDMCRRKGAELPVPTNEELTQHLANWRNEIKVNEKRRNIWLGRYKSPVGGSWTVWGNKPNSNYSLWGEGQDHGAGKQMCVSMGLAGKWWEEPCDQKRSLVCVKPHQCPTIINKHLDIDQCSGTCHSWGDRFTCISGAKVGLPGLMIHNGGYGSKSDAASLLVHTKTRDICQRTCTRHTRFFSKSMSYSQRDGKCYCSALAPGQQNAVIVGEPGWELCVRGCEIDHEECTDDYCFNFYDLSELIHTDAIGMCRLAGGLPEPKSASEKRILDKIIVTNGGKPFWIDGAYKQQTKKWIWGRSGEEIPSNLIEIDESKFDESDPGCLIYQGKNKMKVVECSERHRGICQTEQVYDLCPTSPCGHGRCHTTGRGLSLWYTCTCDPGYLFDGFTCIHDPEFYTGFKDIKPSVTQERQDMCHQSTHCTRQICTICRDRSSCSCLQMNHYHDEPVDNSDKALAVCREQFGPNAALPEAYNVEQLHRIENLGKTKDETLGVWLGGEYNINADTITWASGHVPAETPAWSISRDDRQTLARSGAALAVLDGKLSLQPKNTPMNLVCAVPDCQEVHPSCRGPIVPTHLNCDNGKCCDSGWTLNSGSCYKVMRDDGNEADWNTAVSKCQEDGATLVLPRNPAENKIIKQMYLDAGIIAGWLNKGAEGQWANWRVHADDHPVDDGPGNCPFMMLMQYVGVWAHEPCSTRQPYMCSKLATETVTHTKSCWHLNGTQVPAEPGRFYTYIEDNCNDASQEALHRTHRACQCLDCGWSCMDDPLHCDPYKDVFHYDRLVEYRTCEKAGSNGK